MNTKHANILTNVGNFETCIHTCPNTHLLTYADIGYTCTDIRCTKKTPAVLYIIPSCCSMFCIYLCMHMYVYRCSMFCIYLCMHMYVYRWRVCVCVLVCVTVYVSTCVYMFVFTWCPPAVAAVAARVAFICIWIVHVCVRVYVTVCHYQTRKNREEHSWYCHGYRVYPLSIFAHHGVRDTHINTWYIYILYQVDSYCVSKALSRDSLISVASMGCLQLVGSLKL